MEATVELHWRARPRDVHGALEPGHPLDSMMEVVLPVWRHDRVLDYQGHVYEHSSTREDGVWVYWDNQVR